MSTDLLFVLVRPSLVFFCQGQVSLRQRRVCTRLNQTLSHGPLGFRGLVLTNVPQCEWRSVAERERDLLAALPLFLWVRF